MVLSVSILFVYMCIQVNISTAYLIFAKNFAEQGSMSFKDNVIDLVVIEIKAIARRGRVS